MFTKLSQKSLRITKTAKKSFAAVSARTQKYIEDESKYVTPYYPSPPVVIERGQGIYLWDVDGKRYYDMLAGFACVN
jgi:acetylornithine/succinyldiaminopimelate/putrescine aminotransferase